jgi:hypothetical protein
MLNNGVLVIDYTVDAVLTAGTAVSGLGWVLAAAVGTTAEA